MMAKPATNGSIGEIFTDDDGISLDESIGRNWRCLFQVVVDFNWSVLSCFVAMAVLSVAW